MREISLGLETAKKRVSCLKGVEIRFRVNMGRNKIIEFLGNIQDTYPAIFTIKANLDGKDTIMSYSYNDVLTKNVKFFPKS